MVGFNKIARCHVHTHEFGNRKWWTIIRVCCRVHTHEFKNWARSTYNHPCPQSSLPIAQNPEANRKYKKSTPINLKITNISKNQKLIIILQIIQNLRQHTNIYNCQKYCKFSNIFKIKCIKISNLLTYFQGLHKSKYCNIIRTCCRVLPNIYK